MEIIQNGAAGRNGGPPKDLLIAPPVISPVPDSDIDVDMAGGESKSQEFGMHFQSMAREVGCAFLDSSRVISVNPVDGLHLDPDAHTKLARAVGEIVLGILN